MALATVASAVSSLNVALPDIARAGTVSITVQFFAFFGFIFVILQYVQFVLRYSPLQAGLALVPMAVLVMGLSSRVPRLLGRFGPARVGPVGLLLMAAGLAVLSTAGVGSSYSHLLAGLILLGTGAALATTRATTAIVSSLPANKQGVASAVNDLSREVGGARSIAVLGSRLIDRYQAGVAGAVAHLPPSVADTAKAAPPAALAIRTSSDRRARRSQPEGVAHGRAPPCGERRRPAGVSLPATGGASTPGRSTVHRLHNGAREKLSHMSAASVVADARWMSGRFAVVAGSVKPRWRRR